MAKTAHGSILKSISNFSDVINKFKDVLEKVKGEKVRSQRAVSKPILNFFEENDFQIYDTSVSGLLEVLNNFEIMENIQKIHDKKQEEKKKAVDTLNDLFDLENIHENFSLISRKKEDLFLGDLTGDCTSYHLNVGMNAWTVPIWLSNPGFNMYKITDEKGLVAKSGILLSITGEKAVLTIDSFEIGKGVDDEDKAKELIRQGLVFIKNWAEKIGINNIYINTISNSTGASEYLEGFIKPSLNPDHYVLGGLSGVEELRNNLIGREADEKIYLQSVHYEDNDEEITNEEVGIVQEFEKIVNNTISKLGKEDMVGAEKAVKNRDWPSFFEYIANTRMSIIGKYLGKKWDTYKKIMDDNIETDEGGNSQLKDPYNDFNDKLTDEILEKKFGKDHLLDEGSAAEYFKTESDIFHEALGLQNMLRLIKEMEYRRISPEIALKRLYGETGGKDKNERKIKLDSQLPKLAI